QPPGHRCWKPPNTPREHIVNLTRHAIGAAVAALLVSLGTDPAVSADNPATDMRALRMQEKQRTSIFKAFFPDRELARKAAITFHANVLEADYDKGYLVLELEPDEIATLTGFGFRIESAPEY